MSRVARILLGLVVGVLIVGLGVVAVPQVASAHADLSTTEPAANAVLPTAPTEIVLTFTEGVDIADDAIRVVDSAGEQVELAALEQPRGDTVIARPLDAFAEGTFVVAWSAVSADSHPIGGAFVFSVGAPSQVAPGVVEDIVDDNERTSPAERALGVGRFMSYLGVAALVGVLALVTVLAPSLLGARRTGTVVRTAGLVAIVGTALMISAQAAEIGASAADWGAVTATRSGEWWVIRLIVLAIATMLLSWRAHLVHVPVRVAAIAGGLVLLVVIAAGGHAVSGRAIPLGFAATVVHLAAMSIWVGGLCVLTLIVRRADVWATAKRFSRIALVSVVALAASGSANAWRQVAGGDASVGSGYGRWLLIKLQIVLVVLAIAGLTRLILRRRPPDSTTPDSTKPAATRPARTKPATTRKATSARAAAANEAQADGDGEVRRNVWFEIVGIVAVLAATAGLVGATPPRATSAGADTPSDATLTIEQEGYTTRIDVIPAVVGDVTVHVYVTPADAVLPPPDGITATIELVDRGVGPIELPMEPITPGHVTTSTATFPFAGEWAVEVTARFGEFDQLIFAGDVTITPP